MNSLSPFYLATESLPLGQIKEEWQIVDCRFQIADL
jgi:hypothetical protein